jgi:cell division septation protein DedD
MDDGFHEIQLNGKQLVFLFMAATVVSVVIFLCGVMVGRGVRPERSATAAELSSVEPVAALPEAPPEAAPRNPKQPAITTADPTAAPPPLVNDQLTYHDRLEGPGAPAEHLKAAPIPEKTSPKVQTPRHAPKAEKSAAATPEPAGDGFAVQITAVRERGEADGIVSRLKNKGYPAYVIEPPRDSPAVFRVRVGKYRNRHDAEQIAGRLEKEEQFKPWITR